MAAENDIQKSLVNVANKAAFVFDWRMIAAKYGFTALLVLLLLAFIRYDIVKPDREEKKAIMQSVMATNAIHAEAAKDHAAALMRIADVQDTNNRRLESMDKNQQATVNVIEKLNESLNRVNSR